MNDIRAAAAAVMRLVDAHRDANNGLGHPGEAHDEMLHMPSGTDVEVFNIVRDCAGCAGTMYGIEDELSTAYGDLRAALGQERKPWETA